MPLKRSKWDESDDDSNESEPDDVHAAKSRRIDAEERRPTPELDVQELVLANFVRPNGQLDIPSAELGKLKASHGVAALAKGLCLAIASGSGAGDGFVVGRGHPLPYPYKRHFMGDVARKFQALQEFPWDRRLITKPYHKIDGLASKTHMFRDTTFDEGHLRVQSQPSDYDDIDIITDYFNEGPRLRSRRLGSPDPPLAHWTRPELSVRWMEKLLWQEGPHRYDCISSWTLRETLAYAEGVRECTQFKPSLGLSVIKLLKGSRVLDFSSGWGDRLIAAIAADVERYVGVDPNADLRPGYEAIIARFAGRERAARYTMVRAPFQTARLPPGETFDLVFTSPPYFNFELYSSAADQSAVEGTTLEDWLLEFLFVALDKAWAVLQPEGNMALHIVDINVRVGAFTEVMNLYIQGHLPGAQYRGVVASCGGESGRNRPVWVWRKRPAAPGGRADRAEEARRCIDRHYPAVGRRLRDREG